MPIQQDHPGACLFKVTAHTPHGFVGDPLWGVMLDGLLGIAVARAVFHTGQPQPVTVAGWAWDPTDTVHAAMQDPEAIRDQHTGLPVIPIDLPLTSVPHLGHQVWAATTSTTPTDGKELRTYYGSFSADANSHMTDDQRIVSPIAGGWKATISKVITTTTPHVSWYAYGLPEPAQALLETIGHIGKRRGCGEGHVTRWEIEPLSDTLEDFPWFDLQAHPLRPLPAPPDYAGPTIPTGRLEPPFWDYRLPTCPVLHPGHPYNHERTL